MLKSLEELSRVLVVHTALQAIQGVSVNAVASD